MISEKMKAEVKDLNFYYNALQALKKINLPIAEKKITALIGPSGCGKTTYLRCFNRMHDLYPHNRYEGEIILYPEGLNIIDLKVDPIEVRMRISMVFQKPNPFPKTVFENVAGSGRGEPKNGFNEKVENAEQAALWDEVGEGNDLAYNLSGGQQRLCIARHSRQT
jgi:phosphate transport system ATP-binding protein